MKNKTVSVWQAVIMPRLQVVAALLGLLALAGLFQRLFWTVNRGLDFTDESFRLNWIIWPHIYDTSFTQFGYLLHPLYEWFESVPALRIFNFLSLFFAAFILVYLSIGSLTDKRDIRRTLATLLLKLAVVALLASGVFLQFQLFWITVPGYNSTALLAILLFGTGLLLTMHHGKGGGLAWLLVAFGGWLAFMSKPTTAFLLLVFVLPYITIFCRKSWREIGAAAVFLFLLLALSAIWIDGSFSGFFARLSRSLEWARMLGGGHEFSELFRIDELSMRFEEILVFWLLFALGLLHAELALRKPSWSDLWSVSIFLIGSSITIYWLFSWESLRYSGYKYQVYQLLGFPAGIMLAMTVEMWRSRANPDRRLMFIALILFLLPYAYAFGTNNNYSKFMTGAGLFWFCGFIVMLRALPGFNPDARFFMPLAVLILLAVTIFLQPATRTLYRQPNKLWLNTSEIKVGKNDSVMFFNPDVAEYIRSLRDYAHKAGFKAGTPMLDLTGRHPGSLFFLDAMPIGEPWLIGGYQGSNRKFSAVIKRIPCRDLAYAWILDEPNGPRRLDPDVLRAQGLDFPAAYRVVGTLKAPPGYYTELFMQNLYMPLHPEEYVRDHCLARSD